MAKKTIAITIHAEIEDDELFTNLAMDVATHLVEALTEEFEVDPDSLKVDFKEIETA